MLRLHGERVADIVLTEAEQELAADEVDVERVAPEIEIKGLSFATRASSRSCCGHRPEDQGRRMHRHLGRIGLRQDHAGEAAARPPAATEGEIGIGGIALKNLGPANYRRMIGTVMQDDILFRGSIADNISFFDPLPSQERIEQCAKLAAIHAEIAASPMGYNTLVGDIGSTLSGGQKQRVLLARALYKQPRILILDEATSHLDIMNERAVNEAIKDMKLTRIVVAHRPETIAMASRVIVLDRGKALRDLEMPQIATAAAR